jgi:RNA polymerase sigma factor (sigma-70 family)
MTEPVAAPDLTLLSQVLHNVARCRHLGPEDTQDFVQWAQLELLARDHDLFRRFRGRPFLPTYLAVVATRMLLDWRHTTKDDFRPRLVSATTLRYAITTSFEDPVEAQEARVRQQRIRSALARAIRHLPRDERRLVTARYRDEPPLNTLVTALGTDPQLLYRRLERALRSLRETLRAAGVTGAPGSDASLTPH